MTSNMTREEAIEIRKGLREMDGPLTGYMHEAMGRLHNHTVPSLVIIQNRRPNLTSEAYYANFRVHLISRGRKFNMRYK